jgi:Flp pilus assembly protein protease CpaA
MFVISAIIALSVLIIASYCDIKSREVPDWLNYSLLAIGVGIGLIASIVYNTWTYAAFSLAGLGVFVGLAYLMFYAGQWGGGDSKLIMGIGAIVGLQFSTSYPYLPADNFLFAFWVNTLLAGVAYAFLWSVFLALKHKKIVSKKISEDLAAKTWLKIFVFAGSLLFAVLALFASEPELRIAIFSLALILFFSFYALVLVRAVEKSCMFKLMAPSELTEGDWIAKDVVVEGKRICGPKDLGIDKKQIHVLEKLYKAKKVSRILVKEGIPFVPSFLAGFILSLIFGNFLFSFL